MDIKEQVDLKSILENLPGYVYWKNTCFEYMGCNKNLARICNLKTCGEIIGKKDEDFDWGKEQAETFRADDKSVMETGNTKTIEHKLLVFQNNQLINICVRTEKMPLYNTQGEIIGVLGIALDVTELNSLKKEKETAEGASKAKTQFLENMRHDIRTPLSGIVGLSELLNREPDKDKAKELTTNLVKASNELLRFLNDILESINISSGEIPLLDKTFDLRETLENVVRLHQPVAIEKQLRLTLQIDEQIPKYLVGDAVRVYRVILELLTNSLKFTAKGYVKVIAKIEKRESNKNLVIKISVKDSGIGIPAEKKPDLFLRFKRLTPSYEGIYKGSGLGLSIAKQFLADLNGQIFLNSELNKGTEFVCLIPLKESLLESEEEKLFDNDSDPITPVVPVANEIVQNENKQENTKGCVLVVEDNPISVLIAKTMLVAQGYDVDTAESGQDAINQAQKRRYNFILMDISLPDLDGYEITKNIRSFEAKFKHRAFIIGLTAYLTDEKNRLSLEAGMNIVLTKPLRQEIIDNLLKSLPNHFEEGNKMDSNVMLEPS